MDRLPSPPTADLSMLGYLLALTIVVALFASGFYFLTMTPTKLQNGGLAVAVRAEARPVLLTKKDMLDQSRRDKAEATEAKRGSRSPSAPSKAWLDDFDLPSDRRSGTP
jgi:hypothetical protein